MNVAVLPLVFALLGSTEQDASNQLLQEVRRLREAIEMMVSTSARVQIVFGRLQLQEQRTATAARRLDDLRETLARATQEASQIIAMVQTLDERLRDAGLSPEVRTNIEAEISHIKSRAARAETERQRLQNEETQAAGALASEQGRWLELNQQLEELERVLSKRP
jgi:chromosome segregation ATPase